MLTDRLRASRRAGVPIVLLTTPDVPGVISRITEGLTAGGTTCPILGWAPDVGLRAHNATGAEALAAVTADDGGGYGPPPGATLAGALGLALKFPPSTWLVVSMSHRILPDSPEAVSALLSLRDPYKTSGRSVVLLQPVPDLPTEIGGDVLVLDDPLPTAAEIQAIIDREVASATEAGVVEPGTASSPAAIEALVGLSSFAAEQSIALSITERRSLALDDLWARKADAIRQVRGLALEGPAPGLDALGGLGQIKAWGERLMTGVDAPSLLVRVEEIEKAMAGAAGDTSGVSQDQLGVLLTAMEDRGWAGAILAGVAGSGKSQFSKSLGSSYGRKTLTLDLGAAKGSLVGQSEQQVRAMIKAIDAMAGGRAFFLASANRLDTVPPELRRRFSYGIWFFDLPSPDERSAIWPLHLARHGLAPDAERPDDRGWTGAEIRNVCRMAASFRCAPADCAPYIVPVSQSDPDAIERLRRGAAGHFLSASYPGAYRMPQAVATESQAPAARRYLEGKP